MPGDLNQALAGPLYAALAWQLAVVALVVLIAVLVVWRRGDRRVGVDDSQPPRTPAEPRGRMVLRVALGLLWLVDGLLQAQPTMPSAFITSMLNPQLATAPHWLVAWIDPMARLWEQHPVSADATTVWIQVGLGLGLLVGGRGRWAKALVVGSIGWAMFVWVFGEVLGGLTDPSTSWLTGAPGAALFYAIGGAVLLLPWPSWTAGVATRVLRAVVGVTLLLGAVLQALPRAGYWTGLHLSGLFDDAARGGIPGPLSTPIAWVSSHVVTDPAAVNAVLIGALVAVGVGLVLGVLPRAMSATAMVLCAIAWWFGQGLGVFGGAGTDPNSGLVLIVFLAAGWPRVHAGDAAASAPAPAAPPQWRRRLSPAAVAAAAGCLLVLPVVALSGALQPVTAQAAVGDSGGLQPMAAQPAPDISLTDQFGRPLSLRQLRGDVVLVAFLDPVCYEDCPLLANQMATALRLLGPSARSVQILAVDINPTFHAVQDVKTFTDEHGLAGLANWHFVTGSNAAVGDVLAAYGQGVTVPRVGMVGHPEAIYLVDRGGDAVGVLNDTANANLTRSYAQLIAEQVGRYL
jgi:cytochrome oxidase Cu insertion factor (SCO1/SenC/PrrC family)